MKTILTISQVMTIMAVSVIVFILFFLGYFFFDRELAIKSLPDYYQELARACYEKQNSDCCFSSVTLMAENGYLPASRQGCASWLRKNSLSCQDSYSWCEFAAK